MGLTVVVCFTSFSTCVFVYEYQGRRNIKNSGGYKPSWWTLSNLLHFIGLRCGESSKSWCGPVPKSLYVPTPQFCIHGPLWIFEFEPFLQSILPCECQSKSFKNDLKLPSRSSIKVEIWIKWKKWKRKYSLASEFALIWNLWFDN